MSDIHIIIQRWFKPGHGAAFDNLISRTQRTLLEDAIAQAEKGFNGTTIEKIERSPKQYLNIWVAIDEDCPDIFAKARGACVAIGIWSSEELTKERIEALRQKALTITRRGGYPPETFGIQTPSALSPKNVLIGISVILILCILGFGIFCRFNSSDETAKNNPVVQNEPVITQLSESNEEDGSEKSATPEESESIVVIPSPNEPAAEEPASDTPEIAENAQENSEQPTAQVPPVETPASAAVTPVAPVTPPVPESPVVVLPQKPKSANWTKFKTDSNDVDLLNAKFKIESYLEFNQDSNIVIREHKKLNCLIDFLNKVIKTVQAEQISRKHPDFAFVSLLPKQTIEFLPAEPTDEQIEHKYSEIKKGFHIEKLSSLVDCMDFNSYYTNEKMFPFDGTAEISPKLHELIISLSLNNDVNNEQTKNARVLYNLLKQWNVKGIFEDDCQKRPWFIVAVFFNYLNNVRETLKSGNLDTAPLPKQPMNVGHAKDILQNNGGIIQELSKLTPGSEYKSDSDLNAFLEEFLPYWQLKLKLWKRQVQTDCPPTFNRLLEKCNVQY